jgi:hypothetical protein
LRRTSVTCQPKCQSAVCGCVGGALATFENKMSTLFGDLSAGKPPQLALAVVGNCRV